MKRKIIWAVVATLIVVMLFDFWDLCRVTRMSDPSHMKLLGLQFVALKTIVYTTGVGMLGWAADRITSYR